MPRELSRLQSGSGLRANRLRGVYSFTASYVNTYVVPVQDIDDTIANSFPVLKSQIIGIK